MHEPNLKRRNRVFKSLHKPLTYLGVERTVFYFDLRFQEKPVEVVERTAVCAR